VVSALLTACFLVGLGLVAYGCWLAYHPAGFVVAGAVLAAIPVFWLRGARAEA
jgi:hypothetical protein